MAIGNDALQAVLAVAERAGVPASGGTASRKSGAAAAPNSPGSAVRGWSSMGIGRPRNRP